MDTLRQEVLEFCKGTIEMGREMRMSEADIKASFEQFKSRDLPGYLVSDPELAMALMAVSYDDILEYMAKAA